MLTFANPAFLWALLGLAAPILIHLINRDLFRPLFFPSVRFILRGKMPVERKRRLRDLLLLALRLLLFAAIVTALARPEWQPRESLAAADSEAPEIVLLLDASASMSGWNSWETATEKAEQIAAENPQSPLALVLSADNPAATVPLSTDRADFRQTLATAQPRLVAGAPRESFRQALRLFSGNRPGKIVVISDFQASDWTPSALPQIPAGISVQWENIAAPSRENVGIVNARALPLPENRRQIVAEIRNFGPSAATRTIRLSAGDTAQSQNLEIPPAQTATAVFVVENEQASRAELALDPDDFAADDRFHLWLAPPPALNILAIAPLSDEPEKAEELFFLTRALQTRTPSQWVHFNIETAEPASLEPRHFENLHALLLLGAAPYLPDAHWPLLREFVAQGGRLLVTPGKAPARQFSLLHDHQILSLDFNGIAGATRGQPYTIGQLAPDTPLDLLFRDEAARSLSQISIFRIARLAPAAENTTELIRANSGEPLLLAQPFESGQVFSSAFSFDTTWTDLPLTTAFLPMVREIVAGNIPADFGLVYAETGAAPSTLAARLGVSPENSALARVDPLVPGLHMIGGTPLILNVPRSESLTTAADPIALAAAIAPANSATTSANAAAPADRRRELWPWLALAALLLFIIEMPLAARLRQSAKSAPSKQDSPARASAISS